MPEAMELELYSESEESEPVPVVEVVVWLGCMVKCTTGGKCSGVGVGNLLPPSTGDTLTHTKQAEFKKLSHFCNYSFSVM